MTNFYDERQEAKADAAQRNADNLKTKGEASVEAGMSKLRRIPFGQPIQPPSHHSHRGDVNYRAKARGQIDRGMQQLKAADAAQERANSVGKGGIASDDPNAVTKLQAKLEAAEAQSAELKATNKTLRAAITVEVNRLHKETGLDKKALRTWFNSGPRMFGARHDTDPETGALINEARTTIAQTLITEHTLGCGTAEEITFGDCMENVGVPSYKLTNLSANIRRIRARIESLDGLQLDDSDWERQGVFSDGTEFDVRLFEGRYIISSAKPDRAVLDQIKAAGFRWSRYNMAWQLKVTPRVQARIDQIIDELTA